MGSYLMGLSCVTTPGNPTAGQFDGLRADFRGSVPLASPAQPQIAAIYGLMVNFTSPTDLPGPTFKPSRPVTPIVMAAVGVPAVVVELTGWLRPMLALTGWAGFMVVWFLMVAAYQAGRSGRW